MGDGSWAVEVVAASDCVTPRNDGRGSAGGASAGRDLAEGGPALASLPAATRAKTKERELEASVSTVMRGRFPAGHAACLPRKDSCGGQAGWDWRLGRES